MNFSQVYEFLFAILDFCHQKFVKLTIEYTPSILFLQHFHQNIAFSVTSKICFQFFQLKHEKVPKHLAVIPFPASKIILKIKKTFHRTIYDLHKLCFS